MAAQEVVSLWCELAQEEVLQLEKLKIAYSM